MISHPGTKDIHFWQLDLTDHAPTWDSGIGAELRGGRWNTKGVKTVYASADAATAILEVAVHKQFRTLDSVPHTLTVARILDPRLIYRVDPAQVPNPNWLIPGTPGLGQQQFGNDLLSKRPFVMIPSSVSRHSWNILVNPALAANHYELILQERFALDTRLNPPS